MPKQTANTENVEMTKFPTLEEALAYKNIVKLTSMDEIKEFFDLDDLDDEMSPKVTCDVKTVMIFDNERYNETYMIDLFNKYIEDHPEITETVKFVYVDNFDLRKTIFAPNTKYQAIHNDIPYEGSDEKIIEQCVRNFEKAFLQPAIILLNPLGIINIPDILLYKEDIVPFTYEYVDILLKNTKINECA